jgi:MFS family permease
MIIGSMVSAVVSGSLITRTGRWKGFLVAGAVLMTVGFGLLATIDHQTNMVLIGGYLLLLGLGLGMTMQNLVLSVQNTVAIADLGAASSTVAFFRSLGGAVGVSVLGAILASRVTDLTTSGLADAGIDVGNGGGSGAEVGIGQLNSLPPAVGHVIEAAYGDGTARIFLVSAVLAAVSLITILFIREVPLRTESGEQQRETARAAEAARGGPAA